MSGADLQAEIAEALADVGREIGSGPYEAIIIWETDPPVNPGDPPSDIVETPVRVMLDRYKVEEMDGSSIAATDKKLLVEAGVIVPDTSMTIRVDGVDHVIVSVQPYAAGGTNLYFTVQARK